MSWVAVAVGGASLLGGIFGGRSAKKAAQAQAQAAQQAAQLQYKQYQQTRNDLAPWMQQGQVSLGQLGQLTAPGGELLQPFGLEQFQESPAYQFNLEQGLDAINKATRARGTNYAPATLQDLGKFSQGLASNEFLNAYNMYNQDQSNVYNRLFGLSQSGQNAAAQVGQYGAGAAAGAGEALMGAGNARAAGIVGQSNAILGGIGDAYNAYLMQQILRGSQQPLYPSGGYSSQG